MAEHATEQELVTIELDGKEIEARPGELVIDAAERHGVYIPRFCYHPRMRPVGMCRMCLVNIDSGRGMALQPACMIPVAPEMKVDTASPKVAKAQDGVLEFLLVNHPLDCPVCDRGGECPLQDQTLAFGPGESRFVEEKRHWEKPISISDLVHLDRERCIQCDRCTRFADEVAGDPLISFISRGASTEVNTFPGEPFASYFSGNTVQICPVGALLGKPYRFRARPWDLEQVESTCTMCSVGCRIAVQSSTNRLVRYLGIDVDPVNWGWLCDKGRFSFEWVNSDDRLSAPLLRRGESLGPAKWSEALTAAADGLRSALDGGGPGAVGVIGGARLTNEDAYAWAKLAKGVLGTDNVDCQLGDGLPPEVVLGVPKATIDEACASGGTVVLLAPDVKEELPVLYLRLRGAAIDRGLRIVELAPHDTGITRHAAVSLRYRPGAAAELVRALLEGSEAAGNAAEDVRHAGELLRGGPAVLVLGRPSLAESGQSVADAAGMLLRDLPGLKVLSALRRANVHGALDMGLAPGVLPGRVGLDAARQWFGDAWGRVPEETGLDTTAMLTAAAEGRLQALVLLGADPLADFPDRDLARRALAGVHFTVAIDCFLSESSRQADVVLAAAGFAEKSGSTTNMEGRVSTVTQKVTSPGTSRTDWMIAAELAQRLGGDLGLDSVEAIWEEVERLAPSHRGLTRAVLTSPSARDGVVVPLTAGTVLAGPATEMDLTEAPGIRAAAAHAHGGDTAGTVAMTTSGGGTAAAAAQPIGRPQPEGPPPAPEAEGDAVTGASDEVDYGDEAGREESAAVQSAASEDDHEAGVDAVAESGGASGGEGAAAVDDERAPDLLSYEPPSGTPEVPAADAYSLRLVATRKLYDAGTLLAHSPSLEHLAPGTALRLNPADLDRLGLTAGGQVRVSSPRTTVVVDAVADRAVPRGSAALAVNQPGVAAADLVDVASPATEVRVETVGGG